VEKDIFIRWISRALFAHKQSWCFIAIIRFLSCRNTPLAPCAVLFVALALSTRKLALVAITVPSRWVLIDLIISQSTACEALGIGCIQHLMSRCTFSTSRSISFLTIIFTGRAALVALSADLVFISVGGPACWAQTQTLRVFVFVVLICLVEQFGWCLLQLRPQWLWLFSQGICVRLSWLQVDSLMKIFQGTGRPALGAVALIHFVVDRVACWRLLAILAWAQALQNWDQLVALDHVHDILLWLCLISWINDELVGLEFESYSTPIVQRVLELDLDGHWA
jgi:hypothetical protein